jgi:hypothetical protein
VRYNSRATSMQMARLFFLALIAMRDLPLIDQAC